MSKKEQSLDDLLASDSMESVTFTRKQLIAFRARAVAEGVEKERNRQAGEKAGALSPDVQTAINLLRDITARFDLNAELTARIIAYTERYPMVDRPPAADAAGLSDGWTIERFDQGPFKNVKINGPDGSKFIAGQYAMGFELVLYKLADALLAQADRHAAVMAGGLLQPLYRWESVKENGRNVGHVVRAAGGFLASTYMPEEAKFIADALNFATVHRQPAMGAGSLSISSDDSFMDALDGYMDAVTNDPRNTDRRVKCRLAIFAAADAWTARRAASGAPRISDSPKVANCTYPQCQSTGGCNGPCAKKCGAV